MIKYENINKFFGKTQVLKNINFEIQNSKGSIIALSGPNGSGKSTLVKLLLGMVLPTSGNIFFHGESIKNTIEYRQKIGYMPQSPNYPENLSTKELFRTVKDLKNKLSNDKLIETFAIENFMNKQFKNLSGGTKQKVNAIQAFMFDYDVIIADEPTVGLDPISRLTFKEILNKLKADNKVVILITHLLNEIEELADKVMYLIDGEIIFYDTVEQLKLITNKKDLDNAIALISEQYEKNSKNI